MTENIYHSMGLSLWEFLNYTHRGRNIHSWPFEKPCGSFFQFFPPGISGDTFGGQASWVPLDGDAFVWNGNDVSIKC